MFKKNLFIVILLSLFIFNISLAHGAGILPEAHGTPSNCSAGNAGVSANATYCGDYSVNDFMILAINISKWILGIVGSLALVMFIYGGFMFLISAGSADKVTQAKKIIVAAVIGLLIVFASWLIIKFVMSSMGLSWSGQIAAPTLAPANPVTTPVNPAS